MRFLLVGSGGREYTVARKLRDSARLTDLLLAPGGPAFDGIGTSTGVPIDDIPGLADLARREKVDLVFVGPEQPLAMGLVDVLRKAGIHALGPTQDAARLESSKAWAKSFMDRHGIPTASWKRFTDLESLDAHLSNCPIPAVVKASGLAGGKGAVVCLTREDAHAAARRMLGDTREFGSASDEVVVEEFLDGEEASVFALCDGRNYVLLPSAQDHKRLLDHDRGPNTGGMGAYAPAPVVTDQVLARVCAQIIEPVLNGMEAEGNPFHGFLYVGLMLGPTGPKVVEFNCRMGDPETQVVLPLVDVDLVDLVEATVHGRLDRISLPSVRRHAAVVVIAAEGYPGSIRKGQPIEGLDEASSLPGVEICLAGVASDSRGHLVVAGGRILGVTGIGDSLREAVDRAYAGVARVRIAGSQHRADIGWRGLTHSS